MTWGDGEGGQKGWGEEGEGSRNMYKGPMDKDNGEREEWMWEMVVGRGGESNGGKMGTIVIEQ